MSFFMEKTLKKTCWRWRRVWWNYQQFYFFCHSKITVWLSRLNDLNERMSSRRVRWNAWRQISPKNSYNQNSSPLYDDWSVWYHIANWLFDYYLMWLRPCYARTCIFLSYFLSNLISRLFLAITINHETLLREKKEKIYDFCGS